MKWWLKKDARKLWQTTRFPRDKTQLNRLTAKLKEHIQTEKNESLQSQLRDLDAKATSNYSLWKTTKKLKRPTIPNPPIRRKDGIWAKSDLEKAFASHLADVFVPNTVQNPSKTNEDELIN